MKRICPFCKYGLTSESVYFCENCGSVLPEDMRTIGKDSVVEDRDRTAFSKNGGHVIKTKKISGKNFRKKRRERSDLPVLLFGFVLIVIMVIFLVNQRTDFIGNFFEKGGKRESVSKDITFELQKNNQRDKTEENSVNLGLNLNSGAFGQNNVRDYVPYDIYFYTEFNDSSTLNPYFSFLGGEFFTLTENLKEDIQSFYSAFYTKKGTKEGWVILVFPKDTSLQMRTYQSISTDLIDDVLVISSEPDLVEGVKMAKSGISKSLSLHPLLISAKPFLPEEGQVFMLKINADADIVIDNLIKDTLSDEFRSVVKNFRDSGKSYLVVK